MQEIHHLLKLKSNASKEEIKSNFYKIAFKTHPKNKTGGNEIQYIQLQEAYKKYLLGDDFINCYLVCTNDIKKCECRCGGIYKIEEGYSGRLDCEYCSCYLEVEDPVLKLG